jgi:enoyl-CoA hydratase/carnithine racemase
MSQLIAAKLTPAVTHAAVVTARRWGGEEAVTAAIVDEAVPEDRVLSRAIELAAARAGDQATTALREGLYGPLLATLDRAEIS